MSLYLQDLRKRLDRIAQIADDVNATTFGSWNDEWDSAYRRTGFVPMAPGTIADAVYLLRQKKHAGTSLELGCGTGTWVVMAAAAGYESYGIDINADLITQAQALHSRCLEEQLIRDGTTCRFAAGDMFFGEYRQQYRRYARSHRTESFQMPLSEEAGTGGDPYEELGISMADADILYVWPWPKQEQFVYRFIDETTRPDTIFAITHHASSEGRRHLPLKKMTVLTSITIGPRMHQ